jgi:hypothetical protein
MVRELVAVIVDAARCGDWRGHLAAWWRVLRGQVRADTPSGAVLVDRDKERLLADIERMLEQLTYPQLVGFFCQFKYLRWVWELRELEGYRQKSSIADAGAEGLRVD